jgi:hypothetical protein
MAELIFTPSTIPRKETQGSVQSLTDKEKQTLHSITTFFKEYTTVLIDTTVDLRRAARTKSRKVVNTSQLATTPRRHNENT